MITGLISILIVANAWAGGKDCSDTALWEKLPAKKSSADCHAMVEKIEKSCDPDSQSTLASINRIGAEAKCLEGVMNTELDKRLLALKKSDSPQFRKEMALQADFKKSLDSVCQRMNDCDGSMYRVTNMECRLSLTNYRIKQAQALNAKKLSAPEGLQTKLTDANLSKFAEGLCALPANVFDGGKVIANCTSRVSSDVVKTAGANCHDDEANAN